MDEIDAALDFRNVSIVANYIAERTKNAQFVIISLRNNMFELADRLVGIYKTSHCTKSIAINPNMIAMLTSTPTHTSPTKRQSTAPITGSQHQGSNNTHGSTPAASSQPTVDTSNYIEQNTNNSSQISAADVV